MRTRAASLVAAVLLLPIAAHAACGAAATVPRLTVALEDQPVDYRFDRDSHALAQLARENGAPALAGETPYGLTIARYDVAITVATDDSRDDESRDGRTACAQLVAARVALGLKPLEVLVDRRFAEGSCERRVVLDHEAQHVAVFREAMRYYRPAIEAALAAVEPSHGVDRANRDAARAAFLQPISAALQPIVAAINERARDGNRRLDAPENSATVLKRCEHW